MTEAAIAGGVTASSVAEYRKKLKVIAAIAGYLSSGGDPDNVTAAGLAAVTDFDNNCGGGWCVAGTIVLYGLLAADTALLAKDIYDLTRLGLACQGGSQSACNDFATKSAWIAGEAGVAVTLGAIVPGDKVKEVARFI